MYDGGIRVPTIVEWQGYVPSGEKSDFTYAFWDYLPTFADLLDVEIDHNIYGISVLPTLLGKGEQEKHDYLYFEFQELGGRQAVVKDNWKLLHQNIRSKKPTFELYNLASDPSENHNVIMLYPEKADELKKIMIDARTEDANWPLF